MSILNRQSIRLKGYDYSQSGWYFVTVCTQNREYLFGNVVDGKINELKKYVNVDIDVYCIMPNHVHLILIVGADLRVRPNDSGLTRIFPGSAQGSTPTLGEYIKNNNWPSFNKRLWQRNYYEHIIRNEIELEKIREYIKINPNIL